MKYNNIFIDILFSYILVYSFVALRFIPLVDNNNFKFKKFFNKFFCKVLYNQVLDNYQAAI